MLNAKTIFFSKINIQNVYTHLCGINNPTNALPGDAVEGNVVVFSSREVVPRARLRNFGGFRGARSFDDASHCDQR